MVGRASSRYCRRHDDSGVAVDSAHATTRGSARRDIVDCDLSSGAAFVRGVPHDAFDALRRSGGIAWHDEPPVEGLMGDNPLLQFVDSPGFWVLTSYDLVGEVDRDQERFSSELGGTSIPSMAEDSLLMFRQMMLNMDHPQHTRLRRILQPIFTPKSIAALRASIEKNAADILDDAQGEFDLVTVVSAEMPHPGAGRPVRHAARRPRT